MRGAFGTTGTRLDMEREQQRRKEESQQKESSQEKDRQKEDDEEKGNRQTCKIHQCNQPS